MSGRPTCEASRHSGFVPDLTHEQWARIDGAAVALLGQGSHLGIGKSFDGGESVGALRDVFMPVSGKVTSGSTAGSLPPKTPGTPASCFTPIAMGAGQPASDALPIVTAAGAVRR